MCFGEKNFSLITICLIIINNIYSQTINLSYSGNNNYILTERTDLRRYDNSKYTGLTSKEVKSFISPDYDADSEKYIYYGDFYVNQDTKRANLSVNQGIHDSIPSVFTIDNLGKMSVIDDYGYPSFRSFPTFSDKEIKFFGNMAKLFSLYQKNELEEASESFEELVSKNERLSEKKVVKAQSEDIIKYIKDNISDSGNIDFDYLQKMIDSKED